MSQETLHVTRDRGVVRVILDNPPVNVLSLPMMSELMSLMDSLREDDEAKVVLFESADLEYFLAHVDYHLVDEENLDIGGIDSPNIFQALGEALRSAPQLTIVKLAGLARGGGAEFVTAADLSFAAIGKAGLGQIEALSGIVPGGGGTQYLLNRVGRHRALEIVLSADLFDAQTAELYGWVNRAVPADEFDAFVERVTRNIADLPEGTIAAAKRAMPADDLSSGLRIEHDAWASQFVRPAAEGLIRAGLGAGVQTREGERHLEELLRSL